MFFNYKKAIYSGLFLIQNILLLSQVPPVEVYGNITDNNRDLVGVLIQVSQGSKLINSTKTDPNGEYVLQLPMGGEYMIVVSREGYVSKRFTVSTMGVPTDNPELKFQPIGAAISLFKRMEGVDYSLLNQPMMKFSYNSENESFSYDKAHLDQMLAGLELIEQAEQAILNREKEKEAKYASLLKGGDKSFGKKEWQAAIASYQEALDLKPKEAYPRDQISNINKIIEETALQEKLNAEAKDKLAQEQGAKKAADEAAAKARAEEVALAKAKADKELADKIAADKAAAEAKANAAALAKEKADKELADKLAAEKAAAEARSKAEAELKAKEAADALAKKQADEEAKAKLLAAQKANAEAEAAKKKLEEDAAAKLAAEAALVSKMAAEKVAAEAKAKELIAAREKARADSIAEAANQKELAEKKAKEKTILEAVAKKQSEDSLLAVAKKQRDEQEAREKIEAANRASAIALATKSREDSIAKTSAAVIISKVQTDEEKAKKLAEEKAAAEALALAVAKRMADSVDLAKKQAAEAERLSNEKELAEALAKNDAEKIKITGTGGEIITANVSDGKDEKNILPILGEDPKYKEAIRKGDNYFALKRYKDAKKAFEEALIYKGGDSYAKERLLECEKMLNSDENQVTDERQKQLLAKYPEGVTEETIPGEGVVIIKRVLVKDKKAYVYEKKIFNWGGTACFRDGNSITELVFEQETKK